MKATTYFRLKLFGMSNVDESYQVCCFEDRRNEETQTWKLTKTYDARVRFDSPSVKSFDDHIYDHQR